MALELRKRWDKMDDEEAIGERDLLVKLAKTIISFVSQEYVGNFDRCVLHCQVAASMFWRERYIIC